MKRGTDTTASRDMTEFVDSLPPTPIFVDNKGTTQTANNPISSAQASKSLETRYFRVRDRIRDRKLRVNFLPTHLNAANFFIKNLPDPAF